MHGASQIIVTLGRARSREALRAACVQRVGRFSAHLTLRWKGSALTEIDLALPQSRQ